MAARRWAFRERMRECVVGPVDSVDLTQNAPLLSIGGQTYTMDKIKRILRSN